MELPEKTDHALRVIDIALGAFKNPVVMCSFGKDSMVLLSLVRQVRPSLPVIFHREAMQPHKYAFANRVISEWALKVYDYPPCRTEIQEGGGELEIVNHYQIGHQTCALPTGIRDPGDSVPFSCCALDEIYGKPFGNFSYPWDLVFHGHKSSDVDPVLGKVPLASDFARNTESASACFPLRDFTDADVWDYTEKNYVPIHHERYEKVNGAWRERDDKTHNPDYISACTACMWSSGPKAVPCPKLNGLLVSNVSAQLRHAPKLNLSYLGG